LAIDHNHARLIASALQKHPLVRKVMPVETNLIIFEMQDHTDQTRFIDHMREKEILLLPISENRLRMVTHLDISADMVAIVIKTLSQIN
jgi:threonine aldolase